MFKFVPTMTTGVIQTFGKFSRIASPGLNFYLPFLQSIQIVSNRLCQNQFNIQVRTADKVFPVLDISLQYRIKHQDTSKAFFQMTDPQNQMISYTDNTVRRAASHLTLDQLFQSQSHVADAILQYVGPKMKEGGFTIQSAQIRNIRPPEEVLSSMNEINASQRRKIAAKNDGQAAKIKAVLLAEADAKQKSLRGKGIAEMRSNITQGWTQSVIQMSQKAKITPKEVLNFMIKVLQQETLQTMSKNAGTKVIFADKSIEKMNVFKEEMIGALQTQEKEKK